MTVLALPADGQMTFTGVMKRELPEGSLSTPRGEAGVTG